MSVNKRLKVAGFFLSLSEWDRHVEVIRQIMNSLEDFEPYAAFLRITKGRQNYIQASNISEFLRENGIRVEERLLGMIVHLYDTSFENRLNFGDFLRMVLTRDNPDMRFESALRPNYDVVGSENKLQEEIEYTLARFFKKASEFLDKLINDSDTQRLIEERAIFDDVDSTGTRRIDFVNLKAFFETSKIVPRDSEIIAILRVIDINDDGIITEDELDYFMDLFSRREPSESALRKLRMIKKAETTSSFHAGQVKTKVTKSVVVEEIPSSRFSNYTPKRADNVARTPPKPAEAGTNHFSSTQPVSRPFTHTMTSELARTQPIGQREYMYQSRELPAGDRLNNTVPVSSQHETHQPREKQTSTYRFEDAQETSQNPLNGTQTSQNGQGNQPPSPVSSVTRVQPRSTLPVRARTPLGGSARREEAEVNAGANGGNGAGRTHGGENGGAEDGGRAAGARVEVVERVERYRSGDGAGERRVGEYRRNSGIGGLNQTGRTVEVTETTVVRDREYSSRRARDREDREERPVAGGTKFTETRTIVRDRTRDAPEASLYASNPGRARSPITSSITPEELARRERTPVLVTREVVETRSDPFDSSGRYHRSTQVTRTETVETKLLKDLELRLISSFRCIIDIEKAVESAKQELALRPDYCLKDHFKMIDQEGKGGFNFLELSNFLKRIKLTLDKSNSLSKLFEEADQDGDGLVNSVEFQDLVSPKQKEYKLLLNCRVERGAGSGYDYEKLFTNETKRLIKAVIMALLERIRLSEQTRSESYFTKTEVQSLFALIDRNKDGFIDRSELRDFLIANNLQSTQKEQEYLFAKFDSDMDTRIKVTDLVEFYAS